MLRLICATLFVLSAAPVYAGENCTCRYEDAEVEEGKTACIRTNNGMRMARCERVLNNTSWKFLEQPCPYAVLDNDQIMTPVDPETLETISAISG